MKESEIRNKEIFNKYLELAKEDAERFFKRRDFIEIVCPACGSMDYSPEFKKSGFTYVSCKRCFTLFVNPRPQFKDLKDFYTNSPSTSFWVNYFFKPVAEVRREKIFRPRAEYINRILGAVNSNVIGDIGAGFGLFLEELKSIRPGNRYIAIEPSSEMADICMGKGLEVKCASLEDLEDGREKFDLLTAFELIEHLFDPGAFLKKARSLLKQDGYFFMTTLNGMGFDISLLWENSKSISPPHHLNFFNPESMRVLLEQSGFDVADISTPGMLDWDIVEGMIKNEDARPGRIWESLAQEGSGAAKKELQDWISRNNRSSHMRALAKKRA